MLVDYEFKQSKSVIKMLQVPLEPKTANVARGILMKFKESVVKFNWKAKDPNSVLQFEQGNGITQKPS